MSDEPAPDDHELTLSDLTYTYGPAEPLLKEGVTPGWLILSDGAPGPAKMKQVAALVDGEGVVTFEDVGDWQDVNVVDDQE